MNTKEIKRATIGRLPQYLRYMKQAEVSKATISRIPVYLNYLKAVDSGIQNISATSLAKGLGLGEVQVRKDLGAVCGAGRPRVGYDRAELTTCLEDCLGGRPVAAVIVGAGKLGRALLDYAGFSEYGTNILAAFDLNVPAEGDRSELKPVLPMSALADFCAANNVSIGIVTVPKEAAQAVTDVLYRSGVRAFWCFAPCRLQLPPDAVIQYENLALSLAHLKARL